jgi:hypothetical protein
MAWNSGAVRERRDLALENLALRQQLAVLKRRKRVPRLGRKDRVFWVVLSGNWPHWRKAVSTSLKGSQFHQAKRSQVVEILIGGDAVRTLYESL